MQVRGATLLAAAALGPVPSLGWLYAGTTVVLGMHLMAIETAVTAPRYLLYPFVWINVGAWAAMNAEPNPGSGRHWFLA